MTVAFSHWVLMHPSAVDVEFIFFFFLGGSIIGLIFLLEPDINFSGCGGV